jgi:FAD synthetase
MKRVMASGVFDLVHPGHLFYLRKAKRLGDHLIVVITSDGHAAASKRQPHHSQYERAELVASLEPVDEVLIGADPYDLLATVGQANPQVIALGHDQSFDPEELRQTLARAGLAVDVVRLPEQAGGKRTTALLAERSHK